MPERNTTALSFAAALAFAVALPGETAQAQQLPAGGPFVVPKLSLAIPQSEDSVWQITFIREMAVDGNGNIFVFENTDRTIRMFDANGKPVRRFGVRGGGPGEFTQPGRLAVLRDSLWVIEVISNRVTAFSIRDRGMRTIQVPRGSSQNDFLFLAANGFVLGEPVAGGLPGVAVDASQPIPRRYLLIDENRRQVAQLLGEQPPLRQLVVFGSPSGSSNASYRGRSSRAQPFADAPKIVVSADGRSIVHVRTVAQSSNASTLDVTKIGMRGETLWTRRFSFRSQRVTPQYIDRYIDSLSRPQTVRPGMTMIIDRKMLEDSLYRAPFWPPVTNVIAGVDGTIWLRQGGPIVGGERYWRLSPDGAYEAAVQMPVGFQLLRASRTQLWGWRYDDDELTVIERYSIPGATR